MKVITYSIFLIAIFVVFYIVGVGGYIFTKLNHIIYRKILKKK